MLGIFEDYSCFVLWQIDELGQLSHPQPQPVFPFFLSLTILEIISDTIKTKTAPIIIVPIKVSSPKIY